MPDGPKDRVITPRIEPVTRVEISFDHNAKHLLESLLGLFKTVPVTLKRIETKVDKMALNFDKLNAGLTALNESNNALVASFNEIVKEFQALKEQINDPANQAQIDAFGDSLVAAAATATAQAQAFRDINPDLPPPPPPDEGAKRRR
jgi:hypothetical protein